MRLGLVLLFTITFSIMLIAQNERAKMAGAVLDQNGESIMAITVGLIGSTKGGVTNNKGFYEITDIVPGKYTVQVSGLGFKNQMHEVILKSNETFILNIKLEEETQNLGEVVISGMSSSTTIKQKGYNVEAIDTKTLKLQSLELNQVMDRSPGIRVRQSGGMGSEVNYSLDGMSGNSIRFLIDGIPVDYYGASYKINNFPMALVERIDIYKGVVPVELGADALGGAVNITTKKQSSNFADLSYSIGSFNTHRLSFQGQLIEPKSGFTTRVSAFYNYSDNDYKVWGTSVFYADESTGFRPVLYTKDNPAVRFNDDINSLNGKIDIGFKDKKWADQFFISLVASNLDRGIQTGQTMATVFGNVRYNQGFMMPSIIYQKNDLFFKGLNTNIWLGYSDMESVLTDTSRVQFGWTGDSIGYDMLGGELGYTKSIFTRKSKAWVGRINETFQINKTLKLGLNYVGAKTEQTGKDPYAASYRIPYTEPQYVTTNFVGISIENKAFQERLNSSLFVKYYNFKASVNDVEYQEGNIPTSKAITNKQKKWGGGMATSYKVVPAFIIKFSCEQAVRLPSVREALGNGVTVLNNPYIEPEESFNINLGTILGRYKLGVGHGVRITVNAFYRDTRNLLKMGEATSMGTAMIENIDKVLGKGVEFDAKYDFKHKIEISANATYQDLRNNMEYDYETGAKNIVYKDRLRNEPYFMANGSLRLNFDNIIQQDSKMIFYLTTGYVHEFYLRWPSLGSKNTKDIVPSQLVFDTGISYKFPSNRISLAFDCSNIFNEQLYDNYLLQKPGRAIYFKLAYQIK